MSPALGICGEVGLEDLYPSRAGDVGDRAIRRLEPEDERFGQDERDHTEDRDRSDQLDEREACL